MKNALKFYITQISGLQRRNITANLSGEIVCLVFERCRVAGPPLFDGIGILKGRND
jgi:hypothetical protein